MILAAGQARKTRVLIVIDVRLYREGLAATLAEHESFVIVGTTASKDSAMDAVVEAQPDLVIVDVALPDALGLMRGLGAHTPTTRIVAFAVDDDVSAVLDCAEAGAAGFVTANASIEELVSAMERTIAGELLCSPRMAAALLQRAVGRSERPLPLEPRPSAKPPVDSLTSRERQVLEFLQRGMANKEIASALCIAEATVKNHVHHLLEKLNVSSRWQAANLSTSSSSRTVYTADASEGVHRRSRSPESAM